MRKAKKAGLKSYLGYRDHMYEESVLLMLQSHFPEIKVTRSEVVKETLWPQGVKLNNPWERNAVTGYVIQFP